jgi:hypothetical protein
VVARGISRWYQFFLTRVSVVGCGCALGQLDYDGLIAEVAHSDLPDGTV